MAKKKKKNKVQGRNIVIKQNANIDFSLTAPVALVFEDYFARLSQALSEKNSETNYGIVLDYVQAIIRLPQEKKIVEHKDQLLSFIDQIILYAPYSERRRAASWAITLHYAAVIAYERLSKKGYDAGIEFLYRYAVDKIEYYNTEAALDKKKHEQEEEEEKEIQALLSAKQFVAAAEKCQARIDLGATRSSIFFFLAEACVHLGDREPNLSVHACLRDKVENGLPLAFLQAACETTKDSHIHYKRARHMFAAGINQAQRAAVAVPFTVYRQYAYLLDVFLCFDDAIIFYKKACAQEKSDFFKFYMEIFICEKEKQDLRLMFRYAYIFSTLELKTYLEKNFDNIQNRAFDPETLPYFKNNFLAGLLIDCAIFHQKLIMPEGRGIKNVSSGNNSEPSHFINYVVIQYLLLAVFQLLFFPGGGQAKENLYSLCQYLDYMYPPRCLNDSIFANLFGLLSANDLINVQFGFLYWILADVGCGKSKLAAEKCVAVGRYPDNLLPIDASPELLEKLTAEFYLNLGLAYQFDKKLDLAIRAYEKCCAIGSQQFVKDNAVQIKLGRLLKCQVLKLALDGGKTSGEILKVKAGDEELVNQEAVLDDSEQKNMTSQFFSMNTVKKEENNACHSLVVKL